MRGPKNADKQTSGVVNNRKMMQWYQLIGCRTARQHFNKDLCIPNCTIFWFWEEKKIQLLSVNCADNVQERATTRGVKEADGSLTRT